MSTGRPKHTTSHVRIVAGKSGTPVSDPGPILRHTSGPSSQHSVPICQKQGCIEGGQRLRPSRRLCPSGGLPGCTGSNDRDQKYSRDIFLIFPAVFFSRFLCTV